MWNGQPQLARDLVAPRFVLHLTTPNPLDQRSVNDPPSVERWVINHRAKYTRLTFETHRGPFVDVRAQVVAGPWYAETSIDGAPRPVCGMDTIAFADGKITEYWTIAKEVDGFGRWASAPGAPL